MRIDVLGVGFDNIGMDEEVSRALELIERRSGGYAVTPNPEIVWEARRDSALKQAVERAELVLPDGVGIMYGAKILGTPLKERTPGIEFAERLIAELAKTRGRLYLFGAKPGVAETAAERLRDAYPGIVICGASDGYFDDAGPIVDKINEAKPDLLLVCLGSPKQEIWMQDYAKVLDVGLMAGLGGALDVFSGNTGRAPEAWSRAGFEWLYRLIKQPSRIKRMVRLPLFLCAVVWRRLRGG